MPEIGPGQDVYEVVTDDVRDSVLIAQDIEGVLVANGPAYARYYWEFMDERGSAPDERPTEEGMEPLMDHFSGLHERYEPEHLMGDLGYDDTLGSQYDELAGTPYDDLLPFHPGVNMLWRQDAAAVDTGETPQHLAPREPDLPATLHELRDAVDSHIADSRLFLVTGRPRVEDQMRTVLDDMGISQGDHYDALHVVPDNGREDKLDKSYDLYVDDSGHRGRDADGDDIVAVVDHPRNEAMSGYDRDRSIGVGSMAALPGRIEDLARQIA